MTIGDTIMMILVITIPTCIILVCLYELLPSEGTNTDTDNDMNQNPVHEI